ncbi:STAS domain-containing protein [Isoptericola sp. NPDC019693]|uniref:STAS domain-containing protein n=1 Tax=Isoptericola sp. NPDC019693 TaxID=3364009 RepID=UPI0037960E2F
MDGSAGGATVADNGRTWTLWGEIDVAVAQAVGDELKASLDGRPKVVDLHQVTFLDSSGLRLLLLAGTPDEGPLLVGAPQGVREVVSLAGLEHAVRFADADPSPRPDHDA